MSPEHAQRLVNENEELRSRVARAEHNHAAAEGELIEMRKQLAAEKAARQDAMREAVGLAQSIWQTEFKADAPEWSPLDTVAGVISQIDNMYAGVRAQRDEARWKLQAAGRRVEEAEAKLARISEDWSEMEYALAQPEAHREEMRRALKSARELVTLAGITGTLPQEIDKALALAPADALRSFAERVWKDGFRKVRFAAAGEHIESIAEQEWKASAIRRELEGGK